MYRKFYFIVLLILFPWLSFAQSTTRQEMPVRKQFIEILSSYTYIDDWDTSIAKHVCNQLEDAHPELSITVGYAGIGTRSSFLAERFAMQGTFSSLRFSSEKRIPDVLVLIGDEAWMFYRIMDLRGLWEKVPVVLCGVSPEIMSDYSAFFPDRQIVDSLLIPVQDSRKELPVTAVVVKDNTPGAVQLMKQLIPGLKEIVFLSNHSYQDVLAEKRLRTIAAQNELTIRTVFCNECDMEDVNRQLSSLPEQAAVVVNMMVAPDNLPVPVFALRDDHNGNRYVGGFMASIHDISKHTAEVALRLYEGAPADSIPFTYLDEQVILNKTKVLHYNLSARADKLTDVVYNHIPPSFFVRHIRLIAFWLLVVIILFFVVVIYRRSRNSSRRLLASMKQHEMFYNKYQLVYQNMPIGLLSLDCDGNLLNHNEGAESFLNILPQSVRKSFNLFKAGILSSEEQGKVRQRVPLTNLYTVGSKYYRLVFRPEQNEQSGAQNILMIAVDNTDIMEARKEKDQIFEMLNFAMKASGVGVAEYNLVDQKGFATDAWYDNMGVEHGSEDFTNVHRCLLPQYAGKIESYFKQIKQGEKNLFLDTVEVQYPSGEKHWIRFLIQLMEYAPERGIIVVAELTLNIDEQITREQELTEALQKAREADRLKNSFIANMREGIRVPLKEIIENSTLLTRETDPVVKKKLNEGIERHNQVLLMLVEQLIEVAKKGE